ncbi:UDP-3-O-[3-hydroxymyristoyl] N-acetylglucosamine deacetylase [bacterium]|mgnify:CR=1 FL=1|nr:UDP-3-O-[3-hydroxymyristoyl] N-acetylglucosamine deacetylase [bacterium]|tara:strand:- start:637 stop:1461 length:825 start_codon:yes stop_codon:yes gene_type:complete
MTRQRYTIQSPVTVSGIGIHSGAPVTVTVAPGDSGVQFYRSDCDTWVPVSPASISGANRATALANQGARVTTPEHLLAAIWGCGITDITIKLNAEEVPILDGSAWPWVQVIRESGRVSLPGQIDPLVIKTPIRLDSHGGQLLILPDDQVRFTYILTHADTLVDTQLCQGVWSEDWFETKIAPARTFGFASDLAAITAAGLGKGIRADNVLGIDADGYQSELRVPVEPAAHKILDIIGDLSIFGRPIQGHVLGIRSGHAANLAMVEALYTATADS